MAGTFSANGVAGRYRFTEKVVVVTVERKPDFAPWPMVETAIRGFFTAPASSEASSKEGSSTETSSDDGSKRRASADALIRRHVLLSSGAGLIPIPLADVAAVTAVQVTMLEELTKLYGERLTRSMLENFVTGLTGGMFARIGASAFKLLPGVGTLLGGASMSIMSGASTFAVGQVAKKHLESNGLASADLAKAKREYGEAYEKGKDYVQKLKDDKDKPK